MRRFCIVFMLAAGCGFHAPAGDNQGVDARASIDSSRPGDAPPLDPPQDLQIDAPPGAQCPATYAPIVALASSTSRYRFVSTAAKWIDAETDCENDAAAGDLPAHLVVLDDAAERTAMIGGIAGGAGLQDQFIGAVDLRQEGQLQYITSQLNTLAINPGMNADNKDCVRVKNSGAEEYRDCNDTNRFVCECDGNTANPSRFPNLPNGND